MPLLIRSTTLQDLDAVSKLAGELVRQHHDFDALRFMLIPNVEAGYQRFLASQLEHSEAIVLSAELEGQIDLTGVSLVAPAPLGPAVAEIADRLLLAGRTADWAAASPAYGRAPNARKPAP